MRISDWSSDVCSSDLAKALRSEVCSIYLLRDGSLELFATVGLKQEAVHVTRLALGQGLVGTIAEDVDVLNLAEARAHSDFEYRPETGEENFHSFAGVPKIGRAACRERRGQDWEISVVAVSLK